MSEAMNIHMVTVDRSANGGTNYLARTLESFAESLPSAGLRLFVGNRETAYLPASPSVCDDVDVMDKAIVKRISDKPARYRAAWNYWRAMDACQADSDLLLLEDDIVFTTRFEQKLAICLEAIPVDQFVLSAFTQHQLRQYPVQERRNLDYAGTLCMFVPRTARASLATFMRDQLYAWQDNDPECDVAHDMLIRIFCELEHIPIYSTNPSLVNHIGLTSTIIPHEHSTGLGIAHTFYHGKPKPYTTQRFESFCTFATKEHLNELRIMAKSLDLFHPGTPLYALVDKPTAKAVKGTANIVPLVECEDIQIKPLSDVYHSRLGNRNRGTDQYRAGIYLLKMKAVDYALSIHSNTVFLDADITFLAPLNDIPNCDVALASHWYDPLRPDLEERYGTFNAGLAFVANRQFTKWWRENYLNWGFADQGCLIDAPGLFDVHLLPITCNFGHTRLWNHTIGLHIDLVHSPVEDLCGYCGIESSQRGIFLHGRELQSTHIHLLNDISSLAPANAALRRIMLHAFKQSGRQEHQELLRYYQSLASPRS